MFSKKNLATLNLVGTGHSINHLPAKLSKSTLFAAVKDEDFMNQLLLKN
jgi:hypothetical protein